MVVYDSSVADMLQNHAGGRQRERCWWEMPSPIGPLLLVGGIDLLEGIYFQGGPHPWTVPQGWPADPVPFQSLARQLEEYFDGRRRRFDVALASHGTEFERAVWGAMRAIPFGTTASYGSLAARIGRPRAARAVGRASGANPWPIVVPCHRVLGSDQSLTGFGGGLEIKRRLLRHEASALADDGFALRSD
jgi:methylated-DNA-[protein]-cysteine S-methyltransferase